MPLRRRGGNLISASEGVYFPMANIAEHRVTCIATRSLLEALAGRRLSIDQFLETFVTYRRDLEAVASVVYDKKNINSPRTVTIGVMEIDQLIARSAIN
jgi:hypothetical protein